MVGYITFPVMAKVAVNSMTMPRDTITIRPAKVSKQIAIGGSRAARRSRHGRGNRPFGRHTLGRPAWAAYCMGSGRDARASASSLQGSELLAPGRETVMAEAALANRIASRVGIPSHSPTA